MDSLDVQTTDAAINLRLHAKPDEEIDVEEIKKCLAYTTAKADSGE